MNIPTVPHYPTGISGDGRRTVEPVSIPWRPGVSTVSYSGPTRAEIAERLPRARVHHGAAMFAARQARIAGDFGAHVRALRNAQMHRWNIARLRSCERALDLLWFDRSWFYFDDPEYARRDALVGRGSAPTFHAARSRGEDITYIQRRLGARRAARRARRTPERNAELDRAAATRRNEYFDSINYGY